ncbi:MAG: glycerate kinase [Sedimentisphaerales bacterium]|jgi:glycerate kinase|nr:glycerate kinase [Sedimentisphaerales bacterium]
MKIVLAPDKFKGSLTAPQACQAMERGIRRVWPDGELLSIPLADGGEGTVDALVTATGGRYEHVRVTGPLGKPVRAKFGILGDGQTAVIEMAQASGLWRVPHSKRNPFQTTTFGTGQLIMAAVNKGCHKLIIGIGGSATTDCGTGMAQALGARFIGPDGRTIEQPMTGGMMEQVLGVDLSGISPILKDCSITLACDVANPLLGPEGAVMVYAAQKGATAEQLDQLERGMEHMIDLLEAATGRQVRDQPGAGAAGGLGAALMALLNAISRPGIEVVLEAVSFRERIRGARLLFAGEGSVDAQTLFGKTIHGVLRVARQEHIPVVILAGSITEDVDGLYEQGVISLFSICDRPMSVSEAMSQASRLLEKAAERVARALHYGSMLCPQ